MEQIAEAIWKSGCERFLVPTDAALTDWIGVWRAWCRVSHQRPVKPQTSDGRRRSTTDHISYIQLATPLCVYSVLSKQKCVFCDLTEPH